MDSAEWILLENSIFDILFYICQAIYRTLNGTIFGVPGHFVFSVVLLIIFTIKLHVAQLETLPER